MSKRAHQSEESTSATGFPASPPLPSGLRSLLVVGGSFDPPHRGHTDLARQAAAECSIEHVIFVPANISPFKMDEGPTTAPHHRLAMMKRAVHEQTRMSVSSIEIDRAPPSYTVHTLEALRTAIGAEPVVRLFLGADQTFTFDRWHQSTRVLELAEPLVVLRAPWNSWTDLEQAGLDPTWRDRIVSLPLCNFSSTEIRRFIARGDQAPADWVAPGVLEYIQEHGLYRIDL